MRLAAGGRVGRAPSQPRPQEGSQLPPLPRRGEGGSGARRCSPTHAHGLLAEPVVLDRLDLHVGDTVRLGNASFTVRGALISEPDRVAAPLILGPRVLIAARRAALDRPDRARLHGAVRRPRHAARSRAPRSWLPLRAGFSDQGWRIRDPHDAAPGVTRFIDQTSLFMTLVGLTSLLVGGIGVANGVRAWLDARARTIATLRCLGASSPWCLRSA